ncbi:MAG TPA: galactosyldiacylglycerol synthase, partial [Roseiflexaceae bacterium]|nr:galactosyldiacylglycerol synthase [Roseiflexaceae bacterium]
MPRILIMHASVGSGHVSAARALAEAFERKQGGEVRVADIFDYGSQVFRETVTQSYLQLSSKAPLLWKMLYETTDTSDLDLEPIRHRLQGRFGRPLVSKFERFVRAYNPDVLICTHFLPVMLLSDLKVEGEWNTPLYCVITDYMVHNQWLNRGVDGYFLASDITRAAMIARGAAPAILHVTGIPVKLEIADPKPAEEMRTRHRLPTGTPLITLFGGGIEPRRVRRMVTTLLESTEPATLVVVAGRSPELTDALADLSDGPRVQLRLLGKIDYVDDLVAASDLVITKSGGLIVSEVLARGAPMLIVDPIPGQEEWNADVVAGSGAGIQLRMPESVPYAVLDLLTQPER